MRNVEEYLTRHENKTMLRFLTCGSVDDGKSTLIGRLLYDSNMIYDDQFSALETDSRRYGTTGDDPDLALLMDGLKAEREQGITIDVAYRYFTTERRKFIIADTPGHEQYTRNMVTGASTSQLAIILVDAKAGIRSQTKRHTVICSILGISHIVLAVNKMDAVGFDRETFERIRSEYAEFLGRLRPADVQCIPISALKGDNVVHPSANTPWYDGPPLLTYLEEVEVLDARNFADLRFPVQYINRPTPDYRGCSGTVTAGTFRAGTAVKVYPSGIAATVESVDVAYGALDDAFPPLAVTLRLKEDIDVRRGDVIADPDSPPTVSDRCFATLVWFSADPLVVGRQYEFRCGHRYITGVVERVEHRLDVNTLAELPAEHLDLNEIGYAVVRFDERIVFDPYELGTDLGNFIVIDRITRHTVGGGMVVADGSGAARYGATDTPTPVDREERSRRLGQRPAFLACSLSPFSIDSESPVRKTERLLFERGFATFTVELSPTESSGVAPLDDSPVQTPPSSPEAETRRILDLLDAGLVVLADGSRDPNGICGVLRKLLPPEEYVVIDCEDSPTGPGGIPDISVRNEVSMEIASGIDGLVGHLRKLQRQA